jgi:tetratricopeptide (TPR) repeat protein
MRRRNVILAAVLLLAIGGTIAAIVWQPANPERIYRRGLEAVRKGDSDETTRALVDLKRAGQFDLATVLEARSEISRSRFGDAIARLNRLPPESSQHLEAASLSGECLFRLGQLREADRILRYVVEKSPDDVNAHGFLAQLAYDQGDLVRARVHFAELARRKPDDPGPHRVIGMILLDMEEFEASASAFEESLKRNPPDDQRAEIGTDLGKACLQIGKPERALDVTAGNDHPAALAVHARALFQLNRLDEAERVASRGLESHRKDADLLRIRGELCLARDRAEEAATFFERGIFLNPADDLTRFQLSKAYSKLGRKPEAEEQLRRMKEIQETFKQINELGLDAMAKPWDAPIRLKLAELCDKINKPELAKNWRRAAAACKPQGG